jgi:MSHA biogenesis protein MshM
MYLEHFGLKEFPFSITPDTQFFFPSDASNEALNTILVAVRTGEGFIKITGEVGTGKSMLCRKVLGMLGHEFKVAYVPNPHLDKDSLFREIASELGAPVAAGDSEHQLLRAINERLKGIHMDGQRALVCLDEAQAMPIETLESLRLLTNLETEKRKLLQVIIFGQPELEDKLNHPSIRQLKQRIAFHYQLTPLVRDEVDFYIQHRLTMAGHAGARLFTPMALRLLRKRTRCVPRLVNIIAHKALLCAYGKGHQQVSYWDVRAAANDTDSTQPSATFRVTLLMVLLVLLGAVAVWFLRREGFFQ